MASYVVHSHASQIRMSYRNFGGPDTASFTVPNTYYATFALGQIIEIGEHWIGEVITKERKEYQTTIKCSGLRRRLDSIKWRGKFNLTKEDGITPVFGSESVADLGDIIEYFQGPMRGADLDCEIADFPVVGITPSELDIEGAVSDILDHIGQVSGKAWYVTSETTAAGNYKIKWADINIPSPPTPDEETIEGIKNTLILEGSPKAPYNDDAHTDQEVWDHWTAVNNQTGQGTYDGGQARFYSKYETFIYDDDTSVTAYNRREHTIRIPYISDVTKGNVVATEFFALYASPRKTDDYIEVIESPGPGSHESMPWEVGAKSVAVNVTGVGTLRVTYILSAGDLLNIEAFKSDLIKSVPGKPGVDDTNPPAVKMTLLVHDDNSRKAEPIGSPIHVFSEVIDVGTGISDGTGGNDNPAPCGVTLQFRGISKGGGILPPEGYYYEPPIIYLIKHPWWDTAPLNDQGDPIPTKPNWWVTPTSLYGANDLDITEGSEGDPLPNATGVTIDQWFKPNTKVEVFVKAVDRNGNVAYTEAKAYTVDSDAPTVSVYLEKVDIDEAGDINYREMTGEYYIWMRISDRSKIVEIELKKEGTTIQRLSTGGIIYNATKGQYRINNHIRPASDNHTYYEVWATDIFGNTNAVSERLYVWENRKGIGDNQEGDQTQAFVKGLPLETTEPNVHGSHIFGWIDQTLVGVKDLIQHPSNVDYYVKVISQAGTIPDGAGNNIVVGEGDTVVVIEDPGIGTGPVIIAKISDTIMEFYSNTGAGAYIEFGGVDWGIDGNGEPVGALKTYIDDGGAKVSVDFEDTTTDYLEQKLVPDPNDTITVLSETVFYAPLYFEPDSAVPASKILLSGIRVPSDLGASEIAYLTYDNNQSGFVWTTVGGGGGGSGDRIVHPTDADSYLIIESATHDLVLYTSSGGAQERMRYDISNGELVFRDSLGNVRVWIGDSGEIVFWQADGDPIFTISETDGLVFYPGDGTTDIVSQHRPDGVIINGKIGFKQG